MQEEAKTYRTQASRKGTAHNTSRKQGGKKTTTGVVTMGFARGALEAVRGLATLLARFSPFVRSLAFAAFFDLVAPVAL